MHAVAFAELVAYMEEKRQDDSIRGFRLAELVTLLSGRLKDLGEDVKIHSTRLKERLLKALPDLSAHTHGKDIWLTFKEDVASVLKKAWDDDDGGLQIMRTLRSVREDIFAMQSSFDGTFAPDCQKKSVPTSLLAMVQMLLDGANIKANDMEVASTAALSIAQLIVFNCAIASTNGMKLMKANSLGTAETGSLLFLCMSG
jgi:hypothetical protein